MFYDERTSFPIPQIEDAGYDPYDAHFHDDTSGSIRRYVGVEIEVAGIKSEQHAIKLEN